MRVCLLSVCLQLSAGEVEAIVVSVIAELGASSVKDMKAVMGKVRGWDVHFDDPIVPLSCSHLRCRRLHLVACMSAGGAVRIYTVCLISVLLYHAAVCVVLTAMLHSPHAHTHTHIWGRNSFLPAGCCPACPGLCVVQVMSLTAGCADNKLVSELIKSKLAPAAK